MRLIPRILLILTICAASQLGSPGRAGAEPAGPRLARQILLPSYSKDDWQGSSFSDDGRLFLVVDDSRSFFIDVESGRELRAVDVPSGESLIWARPRPESYQWIAVTSRGRFTRVDALTGAMEPIFSLDERLGPSTYRTKTISFEFLTADEVVAFARTSRQRQKPDGVIEGWEDQTLLAFNAQTGRLTGFRAVTSDEFFTNLNGRLTVNRASNVVAVFGPDTTAPVTLWTVNATADSGHFSLSCSITRFDETISLVPYRSGFLAFQTQPKAVYFGREHFNTPVCMSDPSDGAASRDRDCRWDFGGGEVAAAAAGAVADEFVVVRQTLDLDRVRLPAAGCTLAAVTALSSAEEFYQPWRMAKVLKVAPDKGLVKAEHINIRFFPERKGFLISMAGGLAVMPASGAPPRLIVNLLGNPTGVLDLEAGSGVLVGWRILGPLKVFDVQGSRLQSIPYDFATYFDKTWLYHKPYAIAGAAGAVAVLELDGRVSFHPARFNVDAAKLPATDRLGVEYPKGLCTSQDGNRIFVLASENTVHIFQRNSQTGKLVEGARLALGSDLDLFKIACDADGDQAAISDSLTDKVFIVEARRSTLTVQQTLNIEGSSSLFGRPSFSGDGLLLGVGSRLFTRESRTRRFAPVDIAPKAERLVFSDDGLQMVALGVETALYRLPRGRGAPKPLLVRNGFGPAQNGAFLDAQNLALVRNAEELEVRSTANIVMGHLTFGQDEDWVFADGDGRFDLNDVGRQAAGYWVMPDDPLRALEPEIFMRDYFQPRLMKRLMDCHREEATNTDACSAFRGGRTLTSLNRAQPEVEIVSIEAEAGRNGEVAVNVAVTGTRRKYGAPGQEQEWESGVYDLHLFRAGQLVAQAPAADEIDPRDRGSEEAELTRWQNGRRLFDEPETKVFTFRHIRLPLRSDEKQIEFSAYAFNRDRVKSQTATRLHPLQRSLSAPRRAYLVAVGVSAYQSGVFDLRYADNDARKLLSVLKPRLAATGTYDDIVTVSITSSWTMDAAKKRLLVTADATKETIRRVLGGLAANGSADDLPPGLVTGGALRQAGPDDLVLILYSSHGYSDDKGNFYVFPYDIGNVAEKKVTPDILFHSISSADFSLWLRHVDAGEIVMIIDACHSAAAVESSGFKPGPMGSKGLGQLAYDKGMRILASTRADDLAWESPTVKQGLLSFALVKNGLVDGMADFRPTDGVIGINEWLLYGAERVPQIDADPRTMASRPLARLTVFDSRTRSSRTVEVADRDVTSPQRPALFSYRRGADPILVRK